MSQPLPAPSPAVPVAPGLPDWGLVERVLLIRLRSIGDTVLMTPCLGAIKSWRSDIRITVVTEPLASPLLEQHELIEQLIVSGEGISSRARLIRDLRRGRFDVAFNLHGGTTATIITALSGARTTAGYRGYRYSGLLQMRAPSPDRLLGRPTLHSVEQQLALLCWAGVPWPAQLKLTLPVSSEALGSVRQRLKLGGIDSGAERYAVISPAASAASKMWPAASFAEVARHLSSRYNLVSVVIAGPGEESIAARVAALSRGCAFELTRLDLKELVALIAYCRVFAGNDSGPMHIAAAFERPLVAVFGDSNPTVWNPWTAGPKRVLVAPEYGATGSRSQSRAGFRDISQVRVDEVIAALDQVILSPAGSQAD